MQQPDYRNQSEPEVTAEAQENTRPVNSELQNQEASQTEDEEKETDHAMVSSVNNNVTGTNF